MPSAEPVATSLKPTQQTAKTQYATINGNTKIAYRTLGPSTGTPFVLLQHFRGTMDHWDPLLINLLSAHRPLLLLDNTGVGKSEGEIPTTYAAWADNVISLLSALHIPQVDLLGFSMGGCVAQMVALTAPHLVRKLVLAATMPSLGPDSVTGEMPPFLRLAHAETAEENEATMAETYYRATDAGRAAAKASWERIHERQGEEGEKRSEAVDQAGTERQIAAFMQWMSGDATNSFERLSELKMPVFVANGDDDALMPVPNTWILFRGIEDVRLAIYPAAGHGFINQYAPRFAVDVQNFLDGDKSIKV